VPDCHDGAFLEHNAGSFAGTTIPSLPVVERFMTMLSLAPLFLLQRRRRRRRFLCM
jgi:hypothetical protein